MPIIPPAVDYFNKGPEKKTQMKLNLAKRIILDSGFVFVLTYKVGSVWTEAIGNKKYRKEI